MSPKELAKLVKLCRKLGITNYKEGNVEFTIDLDKQPIRAKSTPKQTQVYHEQGDIEAEDTWESLSDEQKMFYSVNPGELEAQREDN